MRAYSSGQIPLAIRVWFFVCFALFCFVFQILKLNGKYSQLEPFTVTPYSSVICHEGITNFDSWNLNERTNQQTKAELSGKEKRGALLYPLDILTDQHIKPTQWNEWFQESFLCFSSFQIDFPSIPWRYILFSSHWKQKVLLGNCIFIQLYASADMETLYIEIIPESDHNLNQSVPRSKPDILQIKGKNGNVNKSPRATWNNLDDLIHNPPNRGKIPEHY